MIEHQIPERSVEQPEPHDHKPHHGTAAESHFQTLVQRLACRMSRTGRSIGSRVHTEESGQRREETSRQEGERHPRVLHAQSIGEKREKETKHDKDDELFLRMVLDGLSALVFLLQGRPDFFREVFRAHMDFHRRRDELREQRRRIQDGAVASPRMIYGGSIILRYLLGKRRFGAMM